MGHNATVVVMTDFLHQIEQDKDFGRKLASAISLLSPYGQHTNPKYVSSGFASNAALAIEVHHADDSAIIAIGNNNASVLGYVPGNHYSTQDKIKLLKSLALQLGYSLHKKPKTKTRNKHVSSS